MKYWITKWALTEGIIEVDCQSVEDSNVNRIYPKNYCVGFKVGKEAFDNLNDAKIQSEIMRLKKIDSLKKQIKKLEKLEF